MQFGEEWCKEELIGPVKRRVSEVFRVMQGISFIHW